MGTDTGKSQQLFGKSGPAFDLLFDAFKFFMQVMLPPKIMKQKRHISLDPHENIVKIVGDAPGEGADGFNFFYRCSSCACRASLSFSISLISVISRLTI